MGGGRGDWYKLPGPGGPEEGWSPKCVVYVFVFLGSIVICQLYKSRPFRPDPSDFATESQVFPIQCKDF
jgi:hypothetical protein